MFLWDVYVFLYSYNSGYEHQSVPEEFVFGAFAGYFWARTGKVTSQDQINFSRLNLISSTPHIKLPAVPCREACCCFLKRTLGPSRQSYVNAMTSVASYYLLSIYSLSAPWLYNFQSSPLQPEAVRLLASPDLYSCERDPGWWVWPLRLFFWLIQLCRSLTLISGLLFLWLFFFSASTQWGWAVGRDWHAVPDPPLICT